MIAAIIAVACLSCRKSEPAGGESAAKSSSEPPTIVARKKKKPAAPNTAKTQSPATADAAVRALLDGFRNKRPGALWDFLPAPHQRDVNEIVREFARKMDPQLWKETFAFASRALKICKQRKREILEHPTWKRVAGIDAQSLERNWDGTIVLVEFVLNSGISDLKSLNTFDGGEFLKSAGGEFLKRLAAMSRLLPQDVLQSELDQLADVKVELVSETEHAAVVRISFPGSPNATRDVEFVRVAGKWIPKSWADGWEKAVAAFHKDLEQKLTPKNLAERKKTVLAYLAALNEPLTRLENAKTPAEFQQLPAASLFIGELAGLMRRMSSEGAFAGSRVLPAGDRGGEPPGSHSRGKITVVVIVPRVLDEKAAQAVAEKLFDLGDDLDVGDFTVKDGKTLFPVSEVKDFAAFRKRIRFADVISADAAKRVITIRLRKKP